MPIYQAISELFPDLDLKFAGIEEMMDLGYRGSATNGAFHSEFTEAGDDAYHAVFGCYPDRAEFEDEGKDE